MTGLRWVCGAVLWCGGVFAAADFPIGPDAQVDSLAAAASASNYLVVWRDVTQPAAARIMGSTVTTTGVAATAFSISDAAGVPLESPVQRATAAFDGTNFLVVWADNRTAGAGIRGALVTPQGAVVGNADFPIAAVTRTNDLAPLVVFAGSEYVVAWQDNAPLSGGMASQIVYARVTTAGVAGPAGGLPFAAGQSQSLEFLVAGAGGEAAVIFQDTGGDPHVTRAVRLAADTSLVGPPEGVLLFKEDFGVTGFGAPIGAAFTSGEYAVLSSHNAQIDSSVFKTRILADGTVIRPSAPFAEAGQGTTGLAEDYFPRTYFNGNDEFLFVRNIKVSETAYHVMSKRVAIDGTDRDLNAPLIDSASQGVLNGAAAAAVGSQYLVVWMDGRRSGSQPSRQLNVYGCLVDGTKPGDDVPPFLKTVARASPQVGTSALTVYFGTGSSTGQPDSILWEFGDGASSTYGSTSHVYGSKGVYIAVLSLFRAGYAMRDFVRIFVDMDETGGGGGSPQVVGGSLGPISNGVNTDAIINSLTATLNFATTGTDSLRVAGYMDPGVLPVLVDDKTGSFTAGSKTYAFTTDDSGVFVSTSGDLPVVRFAVNRYTGAFALTAASDDLRAVFEGFGATNETVTKPGREVTVPFSFTYAGLSLDSTVMAVYTATAGGAGKVNYYFGSTGYAGSGYFRVFGASAAETGKTAKVHAFVVAGNTGPGGTQGLVKADSGTWRITLGNYVEDVPVASLAENKGIYSYYGAKGKTGLTQLVYKPRNGAFILGWKALAAEGDNPSGMALAASTFWRADMALSLDLDAQGGTKFQASGYVRYGRKKITSKKWKLR